MAIIASVTPRRAAKKPFCEDCGYWCVNQPDLFALPAAAAAPLVEAIQENNPSRIAALRASPLVNDGSGLVGATLHCCPGCDQSFADVSHRLVNGKEMKLKVLLKQHRVSPEVVEAVRFAPLPARRGDGGGNPRRGRIHDARRIRGRSPTTVDLIGHLDSGSPDATNPQRNVLFIRGRSQFDTAAAALDLLRLLDLAGARIEPFGLVAAGGEVERQLDPGPAVDVDRIRLARLAQRPGRGLLSGTTRAMTLASGAIFTKSNPSMNRFRICNWARNPGPPPPGVGSTIRAVPSSWSVVNE